MEDSVLQVCCGNATVPAGAGCREGVGGGVVRRSCSIVKRDAQMSGTGHKDATLEWLGLILLLVLVHSAVRRCVEGVRDNSWPSGKAIPNLGLLVVNCVWGVCVPKIHL